MTSWGKDKFTKNIQHMFILYLQTGFWATLIFNSESGNSGKNALKKPHTECNHPGEKEEGWESRSTQIWIISHFCKWKIYHPITLEQDQCQQAPKCPAGPALMVVGGEESEDTWGRGPYTAPSCKTRSILGLGWISSPDHPRQSPACRTAQRATRNF